MQPIVTRDALVHHACEEAIRLRLGDIRGGDGTATAQRLAARRASLDLLHLAFREGHLDPLQLRHLDQLLDAYERFLEERPLPLWPGAESTTLRWLADEKTALAVAREHLREQL